MRFTFDIPDPKLARISTALDMEGYRFDPTATGTDAQQRLRFFRNITVQFWRSILFNYERQLAINAEPNDTAANQAKRFDGLDEVT